MLPEIKFPTDINFLSIGRENRERMMDLLYDAQHDKKKPGDCRRKARQEYLNIRKGGTTTIGIVSPTGMLFVEQTIRSGEMSSKKMRTRRVQICIEKHYCPIKIQNLKFTNLID